MGLSPDSLRIDIAKHEVDPKSRRRDGINYLDTDQWQAKKPCSKSSTTPWRRREKIALEEKYETGNLERQFP